MKNYVVATLSSLMLLTGGAMATAHASTSDTGSLSKLYSNAEAAGLSSHVLGEALNAYSWAKSHGKVHNPDVLTVVDFTKPSTQKRLWVLNLKSDTVMTKALVAHGHNSGYVNATNFSNAFNSHESSLGVYTTGTTYYYGHHGRSLKMFGLEKGINDHAYARAIEMHSANYVSPTDIKEYGRIGRTYGCFGLNPQVAEKIIGQTKGGSVLFAYAAPENHDPVATAS